MATTATGRWLATAACCTLWRLHSYGGTARRVSGVMLPSAGAPHGSGPDGVALPDAGEGRGNGSAPSTDLQAQLGDMPEVHSVASEGFSGFRAYSAALPGAGEGQPWHHVQQMWRAALHGTMQLGAAGVGRPGHSNKRARAARFMPMGVGLLQEGTWQQLPAAGRLASQKCRCCLAGHIAPLMRAGRGAVPPAGGAGGGA